MRPFTLHKQHQHVVLRMQAVTRRGVRAMAAHSAEAKQLFRTSLKNRLRHLDRDVMQRESDAIASQVLDSDLFKQHTTFGIYVHAVRLREVDTSPILEALLRRAPDTRTYVPLVVDRHAHMNLLHLDSLEGLQEVPPFGIREPSKAYADGTQRENVLTSSRLLDVLIMPGLGFDQRGGRLGRGGGYYDAFISRAAAHAASHGRPPPLLVALAFEAQILEDVPMSEHDQPIDVLVTAGGLHRISQRGQSS